MAAAKKPVKLFRTIFDTKGIDRVVNFNHIVEIEDNSSRSYYTLVMCNNMRINIAPHIYDEVFQSLIE